MKKIKFLMIIIFALIAVPVLYTGCGSENHDHSAVAKTYYCPMHPEVTSNKPGVCPICHMDLVLKGGDGDDMEEHMEGELVLPSRGEIIANISTFRVRKEEIAGNINAYSYLEFSESGRRTISARFSGRIEKLHIKETGENVREGTPLFDVYSPEIIQAQKEYLVTLRNRTREGNDNLLQSSKKRLQLYGFNTKQIDELERSQQLTYNVTYHSPFNGVVVEKKIQEGIYINEGTPLYEIADISLLWNVAEVFEQDLRFINRGGEVSLRFDFLPGEEFKGKVDLIYPVVDSERRTVKVRSVVPNREGKLRPGMYGDASFRGKGEEVLVVPTSAVIQTGRRNIVWVSLGERRYAGREVELGIRSGNFYQVIRGLNEGDIVASEGGYLLDSESQLRGMTISELNNSSGAIRAEEGIWNEVCPVLGGKVNEKVRTVEYKGRTIGFCCAGCDEDFAADPEMYIKNLSSDGRNYTGE
jgi:membrane fusion protein, copper/silver efflux system